MVDYWTAIELDEATEEMVDHVVDMMKKALYIMIDPVHEKKAYIGQRALRAELAEERAKIRGKLSAVFLIGRTSAGTSASTVVINGRQRDAVWQKLCLGLFREKYPNAQRFVFACLVEGNVIMLG